MSLLFFDTEFTGLHKGTTLISIGIVDDKGRTFYAEFADYDGGQVDEWVKQNVIHNLLWNNYKLIDSMTTDKRGIKGTTSDVSKALQEWLSNYEKVQFISDVCHYDFVLLLDLLVPDALRLPDNISMYCHDINQDIAKYFGISDREAFDKNREKLCGIPDGDGNKHNSLWDAKVIKKVYEVINS